MAHAIRFHQPGGPEVLRWEEVAVGDPGPGQVRLRHVAIGDKSGQDIVHRHHVIKMNPANPFDL